LLPPLVFFCLNAVPRSLALSLYGSCSCRSFISPLFPDPIPFEFPRCIVPSFGDFVPLFLFWFFPFREWESLTGPHRYTLLSGGRCPSRLFSSSGLLPFCTYPLLMFSLRFCFSPFITGARRLTLRDLFYKSVSSKTAFLHTSGGLPPAFFFLGVDWDLYASPFHLPLCRSPQRNLFPYFLSLALACRCFFPFSSLFFFFFVRDLSWLPRPLRTILPQSFCFFFLRVFTVSFCLFFPSPRAFSSCRLFFFFPFLSRVLFVSFSGCNREFFLVIYFCFPTQELQNSLFSILFSFKLPPLPYPLSSSCALISSPWVRVIRSIPTRLGTSLNLPRGPSPFPGPLGPAFR